MKNHAPHNRVLKLSTRLTTGLARSTSNGHGVPAQNSMTKQIPMNTIPLPSSGCSMITSHGMPTVRIGFQRSTRELGDSERDASTLASISTTVSFISSDGCPSLCPPMAIQLLVPAAVPPPLPITSVRLRMKRVSRYAGRVAHSTKRTLERLMAYAPPSPMRIQTDCERYRLWTNVGVSVTPAE